MEKLMWVGVVLIAAIVVVLGGMALFPNCPQEDCSLKDGGIDIPVGGVSSSVVEKTGGIYRFTSFDELKAFLGGSSSKEDNSAYGEVESFSADAAVGSVAGASLGESAPKSAGAPAERYSETNVQVEGVDEPDIMKNDGKYIYTLSGNNIKIVDAFPAEDMEVLGEISYKNEIIDYGKPYTTNHARNIFIKENKLVVFVNSYSYTPYSAIRCLGLYYCGGERDSNSLIHVYDLSDRSNPELEKEIKISGDYYDARMIEGYVYLISREYINPDEPEIPIYYIDGMEKTVEIADIYYFNYEDDSY
jgi:uncharacterized secreted protein with C-terminal beta-propeller domain